MRFFKRKNKIKHNSKSDKRLPGSIEKPTISTVFNDRKIIESTVTPVEESLAIAKLLYDPEKKSFFSIQEHNVKTIVIQKPSPSLFHLTDFRQKYVFKFVLTSQLGPYKINIINDAVPFELSGVPTFSYRIIENQKNFVSISVETLFNSDLIQTHEVILAFQQGK